MRPALAVGVAFPLLLLGALLASCGGGDDDGADVAGDQSQVAAAAFGARLMSVGEPLGTLVDSRVQGVVPGLQLALNPDAVTSISNAVEDGDERLTTIADTAGMTAEEFRAAWDTDRASVFASFANGLANAENPRAIRDELFIDELASLPVHPEGVLLGSGRIDRPDGEQGFFLIYDVAREPVVAEGTVAQQLDQSPWQVTGGQSNEDLGFLQFQNTMNPDIDGVAWILPLPAGAVGTPVSRPGADDTDGADDADGADGGEAAPDETRDASTVVYLIEVQPAIQEDDQPFALPQDGRPLPDGFPAAFLLDGEQTVVELLWNSVPGGSAYQLQLLTRASSFDVVDIYRNRIEDEGWEVTSDQAIGFATVLNFASDDGVVQGTASFDSFEDDDDFTQIVLQLQTTSRTVN